MKTVMELIETYGRWGQHPYYLHWDWVDDVTNGDTRLGYWEWVAAQIKVDSDT